MNLVGRLVRLLVLGAVLVSGQGSGSPAGPGRLSVPRVGSLPATHALAATAFVGAQLGSTSSNAATAGSFVAPGGDDANPGTFDRPWRSLQHAADVASGAVWLRAGTYAGGVTVARSGITFEAYPGEAAIVSGGADGFNFDRVSSGAVRHLTIANAQSSGGAGVMVSRSSNVTIADDVLRDNTNFGVRTWNSTNIRITDNDISGNETGVEVSHVADGVVVAGNSVHDNDRMIVNTPDVYGDDHGAVGIAFVLTTGPTVASANRVWGNRAPSFDYGYDGGAFEIFGASDVTITDNVAWNNKDVLETGTSGLPCNNITFTRNIGYGASTVTGYARGLIIACASNSLFANNTLDGFDGSDISVVDKPGYKFQGSLAGLKVENNILRTNGSAVFYFDHLPSSVTIDYNLIWNQAGGSLVYVVGKGDSSSFATVQAWTGGMAHGLWAAPAFMNSAIHDYRLHPGSPGMQRGDPLGSLTPFVGTAPDIGRWEMSWNFQ